MVGTCENCGKDVGAMNTRVLDSFELCPECYMKMKARASDSISSLSKLTFIKNVKQ